MTEETRLVPYAEPGSYDVYPAHGGADEAGPSAVARVLQALRGRWPLAIGLGVGLGTIGGAAGYLLPKPVYASTAMIDISPRAEKILRNDEYRNMMPDFGTFMGAQIALLQSRRVVDIAIDSPAWRKTGRPRTREGIAEFMASMAVTSPKGAQFINVTFRDTDPDVAAAGSNAIVDAYLKIADDRLKEADTTRVTTLELMRTASQNRIADLKRDIQTETDGLGVDWIRNRYQFMCGEQNRQLAVIHTLDVEIASLRIAETLAATGTVRVPTDEEVALKSPEVAALLLRRAEVEARIAELRALGNGDNEQTVRTALFELATAERALKMRVDAVRTAMLGTPDQRAIDLKDREDRRTRLIADGARIDEDVKRLAARLNKIDAIETDRAKETQRLDEVRAVLEHLKTEAPAHGRISKLSAGERPVVAATDRRIPLGSAGFAGGLALGIAAVALLALREGKVRHIVDVESGDTRGRFLGLLPEIPAGDEGGAQAPSAMADYCTHHIRTMLHLRARKSQHVIVVTSPSPGAGKTTLTLALGASFAATGSRTLVIDCDLVGHGLTSAARSLVCEIAARLLVAGPAGLPKGDAKPRARIAELMAARTATYDDARIAELRDALREDGARTGSEDHLQLARALDGLQRRPVKRADGSVLKRGIVGVLDGAPLEECIIDVGQKNLCILPVGDAIAEHAEQLSRDGLERLIETCRGQFETILIDTGPVLGSLEAALASTCAHSVLLVVSRGERRGLVDDAVARLEQIGVNVAGVIFNRALIDDVIQSSYVSRASNVPAEVA